MRVTRSPVAGGIPRDSTGGAGGATLSSVTSGSSMMAMSCGGGSAGR